MSNDPHETPTPLEVRHEEPIVPPHPAEPHPDTEIACLPGCYDETNPPKYPSTTCSRYMLSRFAETYAYRRQGEAEPV